MHVQFKEIEGAQSEDSYDFDLKDADSNPGKFILLPQEQFQETSV